MLSEVEKRIILYGWNCELERRTREAPLGIYMSTNKEYQKRGYEMYSQLKSEGISILHRTPETIDFDHLIGLGQELVVTYGSSFDWDWDVVECEIGLYRGED